MKIVKTNCAVKNISINNPCTTVVPPPSEVCTFRPPGNIHCTSALATIPPRIWLRNSSPPRIHGSAPIRHMPRVTAGLNKPPLMRKKTQALLGVGACLLDCEACRGGDAVGDLGAGEGEPEEEDGADEFAAHGLKGLLGSCLKKRMGKWVRRTMKWLRRLSGILFRNGRRRSESSREASGSEALVNGIARPRPWRGVCVCQCRVWTRRWLDLLIA
jgi:hypothetical protein